MKLRFSFRSISRRIQHKLTRRTLHAQSATSDDTSQTIPDDPNSRDQSNAVDTSRHEHQSAEPASVTGDEGQALTTDRETQTSSPQPQPESEGTARSSPPPVVPPVPVEDARSIPGEATSSRPLPRIEVSEPSNEVHQSTVRRPTPAPPYVTGPTNITPLPDAQPADPSPPAETEDHLPSRLELPGQPNATLGHSEILGGDVKHPKPRKGHQHSRPKGWWSQFTETVILEQAFHGSAAPAACAHNKTDHAQTRSITEENKSSLEARGGKPAQAVVATSTNVSKPAQSSAGQNSTSPNDRHSERSAVNKEMDIIISRGDEIYKIFGYISGGAYGDVVAARTKNGSAVAIKIMNKLSMYPDERALILQETAILRRATLERRAGLVRLISAWSDFCNVYLVMVS
ncbi:hypothetical protein BDW22DRAFT_981518 [Trametopsis cervina]|nr:hypothetical protein BDW22DRAFT_981518 [Trametopsis cervina]